MWLVSLAFAQDIVIEGEVPEDGLDHFFLPFDVPEGIAEIEVRHDDLSEENILDWGLYDPDGHRGWGGGNTEPVVINALAASRSYLPGEITAGQWSVVVGKAKIAARPATYRVEIDLRAEATLPPQLERAPYAPVPALSGEARWYAGDLHVHSRESGDATATLDEIADLARARGLDFVVITDHNTVSHLDYLASAQARHPDVLLLPGTEFTTYQGHAGAFGVRAWVDHKIGQPSVTIESAAAAYEQQGALLSINHPALDLGEMCIGCAWDLPMPLDTLAGVEIGTGGWEPTGFLFTPDVLALWDGLSASGSRIAALGGSDDHRAGTDTGPLASPIGSPTTLVYATELSESAILDGIAAGRTVVKLWGPEDPMLTLSVEDKTASALATGAESGEIVWVIDGAYGERVPISSDPFEAILELPEAARAVRAEIDIGGSPVTVASYVWREAAEPPSGGDPPGRCGCSAQPSAQRGASLVLLLLAGLFRRRPPNAGPLG